MKKMYLLLCLLCFTVQAKYYKAVLTFQDGTVKNGFAEMVEMQDSKVKFRLSEKGDTEKIVSDDLKKIEYTDDEQNQYIAERLFLHTDKGEKGIKLGTKKYWLYIAYSNGLKIAADVTQSTYRYNAANGTSTGASGGVSLFMGKEKEDGVFFIFYLSDMMSVNVGMDKSVRSHCALLVKDCPKFIEAVNAENFKKATLANRLIELYEKNNCNKKGEVKAVGKVVTKPNKSKNK